MNIDNDNPSFDELRCRRILQELPKYHKDKMKEIFIQITDYKALTPSQINYLFYNPYNRELTRLVIYKYRDIVKCLVDYIEFIDD